MYFAFPIPLHNLVQPSALPVPVHSPSSVSTPAVAAWSRHLRRPSPRACVVVPGIGGEANQPLSSFTVSPVESGEVHLHGK